jgi:hypothetical protein
VNYTTLQTLEVRWFLEGKIPTPVRQWFSDECPGEPITDSETRVDCYFYLPGCDGTNLKLRQQKLELKWRKSALGVRQFGEKLGTGENLNSWQGNLERWLKWSYADLSMLDDVKNQPWLKVRKTRSQRCYQDVNCEITQLEIKGKNYWSLGFEIPEIKRDAETHFEQVVHWIGKTNPNIMLRSSKSSAYSEWLNTHFFEQIFSSIYSYV